MSLSRAERNRAIAGDFDEDDYLGFAEASSVGPVAPVVDFRKGLFAAQQRAWDHPEPKLLCSRRAGKSHFFSAKLSDAAINHPWSTNPYIGNTLKNAKLQLWPVLKRIIREAGLEDGVDVHYNEQTLQASFQGAGSVLLGGCDSRPDCGRWRGFKFAAAAIDECGHFGEWLEELTEEAVEPSLMDFHGWLGHGGSPGPILRGWWYARTRPGLTEADGVLRWTWRDNPTLLNPEAYVLRVMKQRKWTKDTPTYRREYEGEWVDDPGALVFPLDIDRNFVDQLPTRGELGFHLDPTQWRIVIGADIGYVHPLAIVVTATHPLDPYEYVIHVEKHVGMITPQFRIRIRKLRSFWPRAIVVVDTGGEGKPYAEDIMRHGIAVEAAKKTNKAAFIRIARDNIIGGVTKLVRQHEVEADGDKLTCSVEPLVDECAVVGWDEDHEGIADGQEDDACHGLMYAMRRQHHYREGHNVPPPEPGSIEAIEAEAERLRAARERMVKYGQRQRRAWS